MAGELAIALDAPGDLPVVAEHQALEWSYAGPADARFRLWADGLELEPFLRPGLARWFWRWNPGAAVGQHQLVLEQAGERREWLVRVQPRKIDQERYEALIDDVQTLAHGLAFELGAAAAEGAAASGQPQAEQRLERYYQLIEGMLPPLERAVERIAARPRETLGGETTRLPLGRASGIDAEALARIAQGVLDEAPPEIAAELQAALRAGGGLLPREISERQSRPSFDTYEHRLLKTLLGRMRQFARQTAALAERESTRQGAGEQRSAGRAARIQQIASRCAAAERSLRSMQALPLLAGVAPLAAFRGATPLLQRDPNYRVVYRTWQALRQETAIELESPLFHVPISDLPYLYEAWCVLQLAVALLDLGGTLRSQQLVRGEAGTALHTVALVEDAPLLVLDFPGATISLRYQPRFRPAAAPAALHSLDRHTRVPDAAVVLERPGAPPRLLVFDAKYRVESDGRGVPQDALADAYAYQGAIGYAGQRAVAQTLLLYPGQRDERYPSAVGALAVLPGSVAVLGEVLRQFTE